MTSYKIWDFMAEADESCTQNENEWQVKPPYRPSLLSYDQLNFEYILCTLVLRFSVFRFASSSTRHSTHSQFPGRKQNFRFPPNNKFLLYNINLFIRRALLVSLEGVVDKLSGRKPRIDIRINRTECSH